MTYSGRRRDSGAIFFQFSAAACAVCLRWSMTEREREHDACVWPWRRGGRGLHRGLNQPHTAGGSVSAGGRHRVA